MAVKDTSFFNRGDCRDQDPALFAGGSAQRVNRAKAICNARPCPVLGECLAYAIETNQIGVWGGKSKKERDQIRREQP